jgi:3',5'-nucleoside bisphosphate phosphatase
METAAANGVKTLALTDHDTTNGLAEARSAADQLGLQLVPGIELSTDYGAADVHLLAYGIDVESRPLQEFLGWQRAGRIGRVQAMVAILRENGMPIQVDRVFQIAGDASVGRPHVARALLEAGHVQSVKEAFDLWLGNGKAADVPREKLVPSQAIRMIHENGGVAFVAHPVFIGEAYPEAIEQLAAWGANGIEVYYKNYPLEVVRYHAEMTERLGLAASGGSDYHGLGNPDDRAIGDIPFPEEHVNAFMAYLEEQGVDTGKVDP